MSRFQIESEIRAYRAGLMSKAEIAKALNDAGCSIKRDDAVCFLAYDHRAAQWLRVD